MRGLIRRFLSIKSIKNENVQFIAIGVPNGTSQKTATAEDLTEYLKTLTFTSNKIVYAWMSDNSALFSYADIAGNSGSQFAFNVVLGTNGHLRSFWIGNYNADYYASVLELLEVEGVTGNTGDYQTYTTNITGMTDYAAAQEELAILNSYRKEHGLTTALTLDKTLTGAAMQRAAEIAVYYSHTRPNYSSTTPSTMILFPST